MARDCPIGVEVINRPNNETVNLTENAVKALSRLHVWLL